MVGQKGMLKRAYDTMALLALLNLFGVVAIVGSLAATGSLTRERASAVVDILRGRTPYWDVPTTPDGSPTSVPLDVLHQSDGPSKPLVAASELELEVVHRESERLKTEIEQRLALANGIMLKIQEERETFRKEREEAAKRDEALSFKQREEGFRKQLEILETLPAKMALEHLLGLNDVEAAANMLVVMDTGRAKKIVEAAKRGSDLERMKAILQKLPDAQLAEPNAPTDGTEEEP